MNLFTKHCAAALFFAATITFQSCNDHDFDWEEAHRQNAEYNYEQNFAQIFGAIDPNQDWDMSSGTNVFGKTRAMPENTNLREWNRWTSGDDWYYVEENTIAELQKRLPESKDNLSKGQAFICKVPDCGFTIMPIYQGGNNHMPILHMVVNYNGTSTDYDIWSKGEHLEKRLCNTCGGDGHDGKGGNTTCKTCNGTGGEWVSSNVNPSFDPNHFDGWAGTTTGSKNSRSTSSRAIRGRKLHFEKGELPVGATLTFYTAVYQAGNRTNQYYSYVSYRYYSTPPRGENAMIRAFTDIPTPQNIIGHKTNGVQHEVMFISCEAGSDSDMNDVVLLFEGEPYVPQPFDVTGEESDVEVSVTKRYMVEDMGYSDPDSEAAKSNYTDIDFNDIVVDFIKTTNSRVKYTTTTYADGSVVTKEETISGPTVTKSAKIRALGGTWDFELYVGSNKVFQKSKAADYLDFNDNYKIGGVSVKNAGITYGRMYNTARKSDMRGDGNYNLTGDASWIGSIKNTNNYLNAWDPDANNISFKIIDTQYGEGHNNLYDSNKEEANGDDVSTDYKNVYTLTFPAMGACPKIVAFDESKPWQKEKVHVTTEWFSNKTSTVDQKLDQNIQ